MIDVKENSKTATIVTHVNGLLIGFMWHNATISMYSAYSTISCSIGLFQSDEEAETWLRMCLTASGREW